VSTSIVNSEKILLDSNILIYAFDTRSEYHSLSSEIRKKAVEKLITCCISPQNLNEIYRVLTDPKAVLEPYSPREIERELQKIIKRIEVILPTRETAATCLQLAAKYEIKSLKIFDTFLVATMLENGVGQIITFNQKDFETFLEVRTIHPADIR